MRHLQELQELMGMLEDMQDTLRTLKLEAPPARCDYCGRDTNSVPLLLAVHPITRTSICHHCIQECYHHTMEALPWLAQVRYDEPLGDDDIIQQMPLEFF
jgi:hypothetical protein